MGTRRGKQRKQRSWRGGRLRLKSYLLALSWTLTRQTVIKNREQIIIPTSVIAIPSFDCQYKTLNEGNRDFVARTSRDHLVSLIFLC